MRTIMMRTLDGCLVQTVAIHATDEEITKSRETPFDYITARGIASRPECVCLRPYLVADAIPDGGHAPTCSRRRVATVGGTPIKLSDITDRVEESGP